MPITLDGTNGITTPTYGGADTSEYLVPVTAFKNRIINGNMTIDQRNAGASVTVNDAAVYTLDRWQAHDVTDGVYTVQRSTNAPTGFINSLLVTTTTADASIGATQYAFVQQLIEGFNVADLGWGTADAKTVTISFWVRSSLTGTFGALIKNSGGTRSYPFSYTISSANTWEQKSITIAGDTSGTWLTNNGIGINLIFGLGVGSTFSGTAGSWVGTDLISVTGAVSVISTLNATWQITGVQLEVGSTATSFDYRPYGTELALCQRYCVAYASNANTAVGPWGSLYSTTAGKVFYKHPVTMRASPTLTGTTGTGTAFMVGVVSNANATIGTFTYSNDVTSFDLTSLSSSGTIGQPLVYSGPIVLSAEL